MKNYYETIIIGAGPGGLIAGQKLDNSLIIDKKKNIGEPVQCGEGISINALQMQEIKPKEEWISSMIHIVERVVPSGKSFGTYHENPSGYVIDRIAFEKDLAKNVKSKIKLETEVTDIKKEEKFWRITTKNGKVFKSKYIIGADGGNSIVRRILFPENQEKIDFFPGIEYSVEVEGTMETDRVKMFFDNEKYDHGYAWIFPKSKNMANIGLCGKGIRMSDFEDFMENIVTKKYGNYKLIKNKSGVIPILNDEVKIFKENVVLIGDAAGFADPFFKGGMNQSMISAKIAAECIEKGNFDDYENEIKKMPFAQRDVFKASQIFYSFENKVYNEIADLLENRSFSYLETNKGKMDFISRPILSQNMNKLLKFFNVWQKTSDYLW